MDVGYSGLSLSSRVVASKEQVHCDLAGEAAILNLTNSTYYGLDPVGARIWKLIQEPRLVSELRDAILTEFEVEPARCEADLLELLGELRTAGLVEIQRL